MAEATLTQRYVSLDDAAAYLGVTTKTVRRMIAAGDLTGHRLGKRIIRIDINDLDNLFSPIPTVGEMR